MQKKVIFFTLWLVILSLGPITVLRNSTGFSINFLQRIVGLLAFTLLFVQIILGAWMPKLTEKLGAWVFKFHITEGAIAYILVFTHPLLFVFLNFKLKGTFNPFYVFTNACIVCKEQIEYFYTLGRVSFWLITIAVLAAKLRTQPWLQNHWRKFHILNYLAFLFIAVHAWKVGTDTHTAPFVWFYWVAVAGVIISLTYRRLFPLVKSILSTSKSSTTTRRVV